VEVVTRSFTSPAVLCGGGNYCTKYNSAEIPVSQPYQGADLWDDAEGLQPAVIRFRVPSREARRIARGQRDHSDSNRVQGYGENQPQYDAEVDNVETPRSTEYAEPYAITTRSFQRSTRGRHLGSPQGFGTLNLAENQMGIVAYLQQHWERLTKTTTPFQDDRGSAVWILPESSDPCETSPRAVSVHALWKQTAVELGVPRDEVHHHVSAECIDLWSRWGLPRNFPTLRGDLDDGPGAAEFARPLRELHLAYQHLVHPAPAEPQSARSLPDTEEDEQPQRREAANRPPPSTAAPGRIQQRGTTVAPTRWSTRSTASASFRNQEAWAHFTYVPPTEYLLMRLDVVIYRDEDPEHPTNLESFVSTTLVGNGRLHTLVLKAWAGQTTLRQNAQFSRAWTEEVTPGNVQWKDGPTDARTYLAKLQQWCAANRTGTPMGFPFPWEPNRCGCFTTLVRAGSVANLPEEYTTPGVPGQPPSRGESEDRAHGPRTLPC
jgi:hypothetical protein